MILGRVVGTVWCTRKDPRLAHSKLLLVRPYGDYNPTHDTEQVVAVDLVHAGVGDDVVLCLGSPARWSMGGVNLPVDAAVLGVVDRCQFAPGAGEPRGSLRPRAVSFIGNRRPTHLEWT